MAIAAAASYGQHSFVPDAASYADVFKNALKLYDAIITEVEKGKNFFVRDAARDITEFKMFL